MIRLPPGEPVTNTTLLSLSTRVGDMDDNGRLPGPGEVGLVTDQSKSVGCARRCGEIVHFIVEQHTGALGNQSDAVAEIKGVGIAHRIAELVDDGEVRGVGALAWRDGVRLVRGRCLRHIDRRALARCIVLRKQLRDWRIDEGRITKIARAITHKRASSLRS